MGTVGEAAFLMWPCRSVEAVAAHPAAPGHVIDILVVEGKQPAGLGPAFAVHAAQMVPGQHRASDAEVAACPALVAFPLAVAQLPGHIALAEMDREKSPDLAHENT